MGQQQLLLIGLGVIIVGIAIVVGINLFSASSVQANRDSLISDMTTIMTMAQEFYRKPKVFAGGGYTFSGFKIPTPLVNNDNGKYQANVVAQRITLIGRGKEKGNDGKNVVRVTMVVNSGGIVSVTVNN